MVQKCAHVMLRLISHPFAASVQTNFPMRSTVIHLQMDEHVRTGWADGYIRVSRAFGLGGVGHARDGPVSHAERRYGR